MANALEFEYEIAAAMDRLPGFLKAAVREAGVAVLAEDRPPRRSGTAADEALFAEFIGPTAVEFSAGESPHPPTVVLYRSTFESECRTLAELRDELYRTLVHEFGHFLGFDEDDLDDV